MTSTYILNRLQTAIDNSLNSDMNKRHGAVLYMGKKKIGVGHNSFGSNLNVVSCHAEIAAIVNSLRGVNHSSLLACRKPYRVLWG